MRAAYEALLLSGPRAGQKQQGDGVRLCGWNVCGVGVYTTDAIDRLGSHQPRSLWTHTHRAPPFHARNHPQQAPARRASKRAVHCRLQGCFPDAAVDGERTFIWA